MIYIGADHRGFKAKTKIIKFLRRQGLEVTDLGAYDFSEKDDFNDSATSVARAVAKDSSGKGILICGSAHGMVIQANRFKGIRAITATEAKLVKLSREHNDANILCLSADFLSIRKMRQFINIFINTNFSGEARHLRRIKRLDEEANHA